MENSKQNLSKKEKTKYNIGQIIKIIAGVFVILFTLTNNGLVFSFSAEAIGYNLWTLLLIALGVWLIYSGIKKWKK